MPTLLKLLTINTDAAKYGHHVMAQLMKLNEYV